MFYCDEEFYDFCYLYGEKMVNVIWVVNDFEVDNGVIYVVF